MLLRSHPLMSYKDLRSWPPAWVYVCGEEKKHPLGEVGVLREVVLSSVKPAGRCFLYMDYDGSTYSGCLMIEDSAFCRQITKLLAANCNRPIAEIGSLDLS